jgi:hypothetical protein
VAETTVVTGDETEPTTAEASAHEAAVAEGATAVQAELAAQAAEEAKAAAEIALAGASESVQIALDVEEQTSRAEGAAQTSAVSAEMVHEALLAQTRAIETLAAEIKASRSAAAREGKPRRREAPDREPGSSAGHWYYGRRGG